MLSQEEDKTKIMSDEQRQKITDDNHYERIVDGAYMAFKRNAQSVYIVGQTCGKQELYGKYIYVYYYIIDGRRVDVPKGHDKIFKKVRCRLLEESENMRFILAKVKPQRAIIGGAIKYFFDFIEITNKFDNELIEGLTLSDPNEILDIPTGEQNICTDGAQGEQTDETTQKQKERIIKERPPLINDENINETDGEIYNKYI